MKRRIVVDHGEVNRIALLMHCTREMVSASLAYRKDSSLARSIRKMALMRGGEEVGNGQTNTTGYGRAESV